MWDIVMGIAAVALGVGIAVAVRSALRQRAEKDVVSPWAGAEAGWSLAELAARSRPPQPDRTGTGEPLIRSRRP